MQRSHQHLELRIGQFAITQDLCEQSRANDLARMDGNRGDPSIRYGADGGDSLEYGPLRTRLF